MEITPSINTTLLNLTSSKIMEVSISHILRSSLTSKTLSSLLMYSWALFSILLETPQVWKYWITQALKTGWYRLHFKYRFISWHSNTASKLKFKDSLWIHSFKEKSHNSWHIWALHMSSQEVLFFLQKLIKAKFTVAWSQWLNLLPSPNSRSVTSTCLITLCTLCLGSLLK